MKTITTIIILILKISVDLIACECPEYSLKKLDNESYKWSDFVVLGEVIKTGINYQIKVTETLKGIVEDYIIYGTTISEDGLFDGCSFFPKETGKYLFYLKKTRKNGKIYYLYSQCLGTRKLDFESVIISLRTGKAKPELIAETQKWIEQLREKK